AARRWRARMPWISARALTLPLVVLCTAGAIIGGAAAGAASVIEPTIKPSAQDQAPREIEEPVPPQRDVRAEKERLISGAGVIVKVGKKGIAIVKPGQEQRTLVAVGPTTRIWLNRQPARL